jgi:hypothetical protein
MSLIKTIAEVKEVLPKLVSNLNSDSLLPNFDTVEEKYLVPIIGTDLYESLQAKYDAAAVTPLSATDLQLLKHIRLVIAAYGLSDEQAASHVFFTDDGIRVNSSGDMAKAVGWEYKELARYLQDRALDGTEVLLKYLWRNKADIPLWVGSAEYKQYEGLLIRSALEFNDYFPLYQPMRTFFRVRGIMKNQQKNYLFSGFGEDLVNYFIKNNAPTDAEADIILALKEALANFTIKHACEKFAVRFGETGFTVLSQNADPESSDAGRMAAGMLGVKEYKETCDRDGKESIRVAKKLCVALYVTTGAPAEFITAFAKGPLMNYVDPKDKTSGNEKRKSFRF